MVRKNKMQKMSMSGKELKLDTSNVGLSTSKENQTDNSPPMQILAFPVQSCNRFKCLTSKLVERLHLSTSHPHFQPPISKEECSQSRIEFYQTFSQLIKLGNGEKQGEISSKSSVDKQEEISCKRQLSKEDYLWQSELKEVIWLELQAWHAGRTVKEQDDFLVEARKNVEQVLMDIMNYTFRIRSDHLSTESTDSGIDVSLLEIDSASEESMRPDMDYSTCSDTSCLSLFCPFCLERQNCALRDIEHLLSRLDEAESLFPSSNAFTEQYPLYNSPQFKARIKAMSLWSKMLIRHRLKLIGLGKRILLHTELKNQSWRRSSSSSSNTGSENVPVKVTLADFPSCVSSMDYFNTQPLTKVGKYFQHLRTGEAREYRQYIEDLLKTRGIRKALDFLEKIQIYVLHKGALTLEKPSLEEDFGYMQTNLNLDLSEDEELKRYGYWSPETQSLKLPSYRAAYLFLARIPLDIVHEFLRIRLETKPKQPSNLSIIQLIRELKEGLSLAVVSRERYLTHIKTALWDEEPNVFDNLKSDISEYDSNVQSILEVYLDYLQQWVQMTQQERVQKNILKEEWTFINTMTPHIPGGQALVGNSFCRMASLMLRDIRKQFKNSFRRCTDRIGPILNSGTKLEKLAICREFQSLWTETRLKSLSVVTLAKTLRKDLQSEDSMKTNCNVIAVSLDQLKVESLLTCDYLLEVAVSLDKMTDFLKNWERRLREVVHQFFKFGFEYHKEVCWVVTGDSRAQLSRSLITFARHWMIFAKKRCERGRGLRPRWAHQGFDFLMTICEPHFTNCLTDIEFEELKRNIDECIFHVIGTFTPISSDKEKSPTVYYSRSRGHLSPDSPSSRSFRNLSVSSSSDKETTLTPEFDIPDLRNCTKSDRVLAAINKLDEDLESRLKANDLIGEVVEFEVHHTEKNFIRPRPVKFSWQRGIKIGQGRFGKVYTAVNNETGELMAMKEIALQPNDHRTIRSVALELKIFEGIQHENLVRYYGVEIHREEMLIFMELCTEGMLESLVAATESGLPEVLVRRYTLQLVKAVNTLHQHAIVHRDIKSANIFLTAEGNCLKLGDFGCAVKIRAHTTVAGELQGFVGTQAYMAPEVFMKNKQEGHGRAADIWSLGCVLVEMASGKRPWADFDSNYQIMFKVGMGETPAIPENLSEEGQLFASLCLVHDPKARATTTELLNHTFLVVDNDKEYVSIVKPSMLENYLKLGIQT